MNDRAGAASLNPGDLSIPRTVAEISRARNRPPRPFALSIEVLSLADSGLWRVGPSRVLVSADLRFDATRCGVLLHPVLRDLA